MIRPATPKDADWLAETYNHYILHSHSTFETRPIGVDEMQRRVAHVQKELNLPWNVLEVENKMVGYAYATQWKARAAYRQTTETSVYLHVEEFGKGYGTSLYHDLLRQLEGAGYHAIIGGISLPNEGSVALHEKLGFKYVGTFKHVGFKFDRWINVGYWQLTF